MDGYRLPGHFKKTFIVYLPCSSLYMGGRVKHKLEKATALRHLLLVGETEMDLVH